MRRNRTVSIYAGSEEEYMKHLSKIDVQNAETGSKYIDKTDETLLVSNSISNIKKSSLSSRNIDKPLKCINFKESEKNIYEENIDEYSCIVKNKEEKYDITLKRKKSKISKAINNTKIDDSNNDLHADKIYMEDLGNDLYDNLGIFGTNNSYMPSKENCNDKICSKDIYTPISKNKEDFFNNDDYTQEKYFSLSKSRRRTKNENENDENECQTTVYNNQYNEDEDVKIQKDLQYFLDNDQMLGRDANTYSINQVIPKTEEELQLELEITLNQINENYSNNEFLSNCNEILCKYFKSKILNSLNLLENNNEVRAKRKSSKKIVMIKDDIISHKGKIYNSLDLVNSPSLFLHRLKFLEHRQFQGKLKKIKSFEKKNKKNSNNKMVNLPTYSISNEEDLKLFSQSLSTDSITDLSFKNIINTILSYSEKSQIRQKNQFYNSFKQVLDIHPIEISSNNNVISRKNSFNSEEDDEKLEFMTPYTKMPDIDHDSKSIEFLKDAKDYQSNKSWNSFSKDESNNENSLDESNITEMINDNIKTKENLKILLLGDKIPKKRFIKGLIYSEDYEVTEFESYDTKDETPTLEIVKEKICFNEQLVQLQLFDINKSFLKSTLSKTYFNLAHSIVIVVDLNSYFSLLNCFEIIDIAESHLVNKKISFIIWEENDKKKRSVFSNSNTSETARKKTSDSINQSNSFNKDLIISPSKKKPSILSNSTNEFKRQSIDISKKTISDLDPLSEKKVILKEKFVTYCKEKKCIVIKIKHYTEITVENEIFGNFLKFLMVKKFESSVSFTNINTNKKRFSHFYTKNDFNLGGERSINKNDNSKNKSAEKNNFRKSTVN